MTISKNYNKSINTLIKMVKYQASQNNNIIKVMKNNCNILKEVIPKRIVHPALRKIEMLSILNLAILLRIQNKIVKK